MRDLEGLLAELRECFGTEVKLDCGTNSKGVMTAWCRVKSSEELLTVAGLVRKMAGRLSTITASLPEWSEKTGSHELAYHFDLDGDTLTVSLSLPLDGEVDSLTPLFRNADWNEREFMELYSIKVRGCMNPKRLFVDESIEASVLDRLVPFSSLVNAASTKALWERILIDREEKK
jgi:NADH:ubiquinone oxidoreductase subunit C